MTCPPDEDLEDLDDRALDPEQPVELEIDGTLDLHPFRPRDLKQLIPEYLRVCQEREIYQLRLIHGKGIGNIRRSVHALLDRSPLVEGYRLAGGDAGGWGATLVQLKRSA